MPKFHFEYNVWLYFVYGLIILKQWLQSDQLSAKNSKILFEKLPKTSKFLFCLFVCLFDDIGGKMIQFSLKKN